MLKTLVLAALAGATLAQNIAFSSHVEFLGVAEGLNSHLGSTTGCENTAVTMISEHWGANWGFEMVYLNNPHFWRLVNYHKRDIGCAEIYLANQGCSGGNNLTYSAIPDDNTVWKLNHIAD
jgi:hypothetical protein